MTLQEIADIAARHDTGIAAEMLMACVAKGYVTETHVRVPKDSVLKALTRRVAAMEVPEEEIPSLIEKGVRPKPRKVPERGLFH